MLSRWTNFLTEDGEKESRNRDDEFETHDLNKQQLIDTWEKGWACLFDTLEGVKKKDLKKNITIRGEELSVMCWRWPCLWLPGKNRRQPFSSVASST
jgi:hypothetical protein